MSRHRHRDDRSKSNVKAILAIAGALALAACAYPYTPPALAPVTEPAAAVQPLATAPTAPVTILVSIDGFRPDYLDRGVTPRLGALAQAGVTGPMLPSFPSKTFPNHWTLVTGLVPDRHGIVGNTMEDASRPGQTFTMATDDPFWWNSAEPIWVTAERAGIRTATMFWPGSNVAWGGTLAADAHNGATGGVRPSDWQQYATAVTGHQRVAAVLDWLRRPTAIRPRLVTLYFDTVDTAGHQFGPDAAETNAAIADVDGSIGELVDGLAVLGQAANLVIVADHGMAATPRDQVIALDTLANPADYHVVETGPYAGLAPIAGHEAALATALSRPRPHMTCWAKAAIPARFHYGANPRVPAYLCLADVGWTIARTASAKQPLGNHGYDNAAPMMRALFIAHGPAFRVGKRLPPFPNTDVAPLLRDLLALPADPALDGNDRPFRAVLAR